MKSITAILLALLLAAGMLIPATGFAAEKTVISMQWMYRRLDDGSICLVGLVLVTRAHGSDSRLFYFGLAVLLLAVISEVAYASLTKALSDGYKPTVIVMHQFFIGSVLFLPLFLTRGMETYDPDLYGSWLVWQPLLCLTVLCSTVAFALWAYAIGQLGVAKSSVFQALNPVVTALAGYILGDEILHGGQWVGLGIAVVGVILTQLNFKTSGTEGR